MCDCVCSVCCAIRCIWVIVCVSHVWLFRFVSCGCVLIELDEKERCVPHFLSRLLVHVVLFHFKYIHIVISLLPVASFQCVVYTINKTSIPHSTRSQSHAKKDKINRKTATKWTRNKKKRKKRRRKKDLVFKMRHKPDDLLATIQQQTEATTIYLVQHSKTTCLFLFISLLVSTQVPISIIQLLVLFQFVI